ASSCGPLPIGPSSVRPRARRTCEGSSQTGRATGQGAWRTAEVRSFPYCEYAAVAQPGDRSADPDFDALLVWGGDAKRTTRMDSARSVGTAMKRRSVTCHRAFAYALSALFVIVS